MLYNYASAETIPNDGNNNMKTFLFFKLLNSILYTGVVGNLTLYVYVIAPIPISCTESKLVR